MNKLNKKKLLAGMLAVSVFASVSMTAFAVDVTGTGKIENAGSGQYTGTVNGTLTNASTEIEVQAQTSGGEEIVYDLDITYGSMQFEYDYGSTWNPATHAYTVGTSGRQQGGWVMSYVDATNNKITVKNNSNFPMKADLTYSNGGTNLNADASAQGAVTGVFALVNTDLTQTILDQGYNGSYSSAVTTSAQLRLEMDAKNIDSGGYYYYAQSSANALDGSDSVKDIYFALSGKPDRGGPTSFTKVGAITVAISPETGVTQGTK